MKKRFAILAVGAALLWGQSALSLTAAEFKSIRGKLCDGVPRSDLSGPDAQDFWETCTVANDVKEMKDLLISWKSRCTMNIINAGARPGKELRDERTAEELMPIMQSASSLCMSKYNRADLIATCTEKRFAAKNGFSGRVNVQELFEICTKEYVDGEKRVQEEIKKYGEIIRDWEEPAPENEKKKVAKSKTRTVPPALPAPSAPPQRSHDSTK